MFSMKKQTSGVEEISMVNFCSLVGKSIWKCHMGNGQLC